MYNHNNITSQPISDLSIRDLVLQNYTTDRHVNVVSNYTVVLCKINP